MRLWRWSGRWPAVLVMLREHGEIWDLLDAIAEALDGGDPATAGLLLPRLSAVLDQHNAKEERIIYPAGDDKLPAEVANAIADELERGATPEGWTCQMAGRGTLAGP